jgi:hypothetical protein
MRAPIFLAGALIAAACIRAADVPLTPATVCEVLADLPSFEGKAVAVVGRLSFRSEGSWLGEDTCGRDQGKPGSNPSSILWLSLEEKSAPRFTERLEIDGSIAKTKLDAVKKHTRLGKFEFGTPEYDRWVVVYGRVRTREAPRPGNRKPPTNREKAPADLLYAGGTYIISIPEP